jgi:hypothetical protein
MECGQGGDGIPIVRLANTIYAPPFSFVLSHFLTPASFKIREQTVDCVWNVMAHAQKPYLVFWRNGRVHLNRRGGQFNRLLAAEVCESAVVMLDAPCFEVVWRVLNTHSICQFPLHFPYRASPCAIILQLDSTYSPMGQPLVMFFFWRAFWYITLLQILPALNLSGVTSKGRRSYK